MTATPSRDFMVRQAVLNAALTYADNRQSLATIHLIGVPGYLDMMCLGDWVRPTFCEEVRKEYRALASRYSEAA